MVSSLMHKYANFDLDNLNFEKWFQDSQVYNCSKLANVLMTNELAAKLKGTGMYTKFYNTILNYFNNYFTEYFLKIQYVFWYLSLLVCYYFLLNFIIVDLFSFKGA